MWYAWNFTFNLVHHCSWHGFRWWKHWREKVSNRIKYYIVLLGKQKAVSSIQRLLISRKRQMWRTEYIQCTVTNLHIWIKLCKYHRCKCVWVWLCFLLRFLCVCVSKKYQRPEWVILSSIVKQILHSMLVNLPHAYLSTKSATIL